jgi:iron complex outermembrane receptor protein
MGRLKDGVRRGLLFSGVLATALGVVTYGGIAVAQDQPQEQQPKFKEEVEVTGTLIPRPTLEAMSPVATLAPEEITNSGVTRIEDLLTSLPQVFQAQNSTISNGASGTATVDLRNLGAVRTLVLVDGKRMPPGDTGAVETDLNFIPTFLVKRVDILTGGAAAVYGADAVAGVVNFILDRDFEGFRGGLQYTGYEHNNNNSTAQAINKARGFNPPSGNAWDGSQVDAYAAWGGKFADGKGHATAYVEYRRTSALLKKRRDYTNCSVLGGLTLSGPTCGGSSTNPKGRFLVYDSDFNFVGDWTLGNNTDTLSPFSSAFLYNYGAINFLQRPDTRWTAGGFMDYTWNEHLHGYLDVMMMDDVSDAQIAPSGDFGNTTQLNCDNPMLSADEYQKLCVDAGYGPHDIATVQILRRNVEGGPRFDHLEHQAYRVIAGLKGDINKAWSYDFYGLHGQTRAPEAYHNDLNVPRLQDALIVDGDPNDPSTWHCRSGNDGCVPWDIFKAGGVTQAALNYIALPLISISGLRTDVISATINGDLTDAGVVFPSATEGIKLALGAQYRKEQLFYAPDWAYQQPNFASGQGGARTPVNGSYYVKEGYVEALLPIIQDMKGAQNLSLDLAYRYSDYSTTGTANTWKAEGQYAPISDFKIRAGVNRATRSPNIVELYNPQAVLLQGTTDPCAGPNPDYTLEQCMRTGITAAQYGHLPENPAQQYNSQLGGNPNLKPEIADTHYYGVVITPSGLPGFTATFDYFHVKIKDTIGNLFADDILRQCAVTGDPALCGLIHRDQFGSLWQTPNGYTIATNQNIGQRVGEGVDVSASYLMPMGNSFLNFDLMGSYVIHQKINTGLYEYDCVGLFGNTCGIPVPHWRHRFHLSWESGQTTVTLGWRMQGAVTVDASSSQPALSSPGDIPYYKASGSYHYSAYNYIDLAATYNITKGIQFTLGVNNIFDKEPPLAAGFSDADYGAGFYGFYDPYGRLIHSSLLFTF